MKRWFWLTLAAVVLVAVGATLVALPQAPEWTTSSRAALAEFEAGDEALSKVYFVEARGDSPSICKTIIRNKRFPFSTTS
jgi:hypothetical protein